MVKTYVECPRCGRIMKVFNDSRAQKLFCTCGFSGKIDECFKEVCRSDYECKRYRHGVRKLDNSNGV